MPAIGMMAGLLKVQAIHCGTSMTFCEAFVEAMRRARGRRVAIEALQSWQVKVLGPPIPPLYTGNTARVTLKAKRECGAKTSASTSSGSLERKPALFEVPLPRALP